MLEALGIDFELQAGDVAARGNFCTVDARGNITDRRAGRISTEVCVRLVERLRAIRLDGVEVLIEPVKEHRFVLVLRGDHLSGRLSETDPQQLGVPPLPVRALAPEADKTAALVNAFVEAARPLLRDAAPANMLLLRGFDQQPRLPLFPETFGLRAAAIAAYPMYRGLARLVGMEVLKTGGTFAEEIDTLERQWEHHDFFFLHYKDTDKAGEDGDFDAKVAALERFDALLPRVLALRPDVLAISGDHATPSILKGHGWQGVPALLASPYCGGDPVSRFTERDCAGGSLGVMPGPGPDAPRDGQRAPLHQVRRVAGHSRYPGGETMRRSYCLLSAAVLLALGVIGLAVPTREPAPPVVTRGARGRAGPGAPRARRDRAEAGRDARDRTAPDRGGARRRGRDRGRAARAASTCDASPPASGSPSSRAPTAKPAAISYARSPAERYEIRPGRDGRWAVSAVRPDVDTRVVAIAGEVRDSLFASMERLGETAALTARLVNLFEWDFDFAADSLPGDRFRLLVEKRYVGDVFLGYGDVLVAQYASVGRSLLTSVAFGDTAGRREYYDASGRSVKKMFLRAPLDFTRVTSGFSHARFHPVLGGYRPHLAVDYGAPIGTPVRAVADAVVTQAGWNGGYGLSIIAAPRARLRDHVQPSLQDRRPPGRAGAPAPGHRSRRQHRPVHRPASRLPRAQGRGPGQPAGREVHPRRARARPSPRGVRGARRRAPGAARRAGSVPRASTGTTPEAAHRLEPLLLLRQAEPRGRRGLLLLRGAAPRAVGLRPARRAG